MKRVFSIDDVAASTYVGVDDEGVDGATDDRAVTSCFERANVATSRSYATLKNIKVNKLDSHVVNIFMRNFMMTNFKRHPPLPTVEVR